MKNVFPVKSAPKDNYPTLNPNDHEENIVK